MRTTLSIVAAAVLLAGTSAQAQQRATSGFLDFSVSATDVSGDAARFQRYVDMRDRASVEALRFDRLGDGWRFESSARHVGRENQWLFASVETGKVKASFTWDQVPYFLSGDTRTPFRTESPGVFRLDDAMQSGVETGLLRLSDIAGTAAAFDLRSRRDVAAFSFVYRPTRAFDVKVSMKQTRREGAQPFLASFGFSDVVELSAPIDTRTRDLEAGVEWAGRRGTVRVGYDGSWFENNVPALVWDNPLKLTDTISATGYRDGLAGSQGRLAMWPNSTMHGVSTAGSLKLPARTRVTANVRTGLVRQNDALLPVTINTAAPDLPLPRDTAEAEARTLAVNVAVTSRPAKALWMNARYRAYDFDNRTPVFATPFLVMDQTLHDITATTPSSYTRQTLDLDASVTALRMTTFRAGYTRGADDRTFRIFERTTDQVYRASVDSVWKSITFRGIVERAERRGTGFDHHALEEVGEQPELRHYDVADRDRRRVTGLVQLTPLKQIAVSGSIALGQDEYANSGFGLRDNDNRTYSVTVDAAASARIGATATYSRERYTALQTSRSASPGVQFEDPTRNWSIDAADEVDTFSAGLDLLKVVPRTDVRLGCDFSRSNAAYLYRVPSDSTLPAIAQLPTVRNELRSATAEVRFFLTKQLAAGAIYWYDDYQVDDYARSAAAIGGLSPAGSLFLGSVYRPYTATSASLRLMWIW